MKTLENALYTACGLKDRRILQFQAEEIESDLDECIFTEDLEKEEQKMLDAFGNMRVVKKREGKYNKERIRAVLNKFYGISKQKAQQIVEKLQTAQKEQFFDANPVPFSKDATWLAPVKIYNIVLTIQLLQFAYGTLFAALQRFIAAQPFQLAIEKNGNTERFETHHKSKVCD